MFDVGYKKLSGTVALGVVVLFSASCQRNENQAEWWQGEQERIALSHQVELKEYRFSKSHASGYEEMTKLRTLAKTNMNLIRDLNQRRIALDVEVELLEGEFVGFKQSSIQGQRDRAIGRTFDTMILPSGRTFMQVKVAAIDDAGVTIRHAEGSARMSFSDLNSEQQVLFGLEMDLALVAEKKELESSVDYERAVDRQLVAMKAREKLIAEAARREDQSLQANRARVASQQIASSSVRPLAQPATSFGNRSWSSSSYYSTYRSYRPTYRYVYYGSPSYVQPCPSVSPSRYTQGTVSRAASSPIVTKCTSFAETTLPSIP